MEETVGQLEEAVEAWRARGWPAPKVLLVAGSGLAVDVGDRLEGPVPLAEILPFPVHPVIGHAHEFELVQPFEDRPVLYLRGRIHAYQGYDAHQTVFLVRLARLLGAQILVMTNAAGGLNPDFAPGDLVQITDHLNLSCMNPLRGTLPSEWGAQFPDMAEAYDPELLALAAQTADGLGVRVQQGVYASVPGPSYETPAEVRMLRTLGADLVGMSTVLEVIAARHLGMRCCCLSLVTNLAAGVTGEPLDHEEVLEAGREAAGDLQKLLSELLRAEGLTA